MTYQALAADLKDGSAYLLKSLVESGAVDAQAAQPITQSTGLCSPLPPTP